MTTGEAGDLTSAELCADACHMVYVSVPWDPH